MIQLQEVPGSQPVRLAIRLKADTPVFYRALLGMLRDSGTCHISFHCDHSHRIRVFGVLPTSTADCIRLMGGTIVQLTIN